MPGSVVTSLQAWYRKLSVCNRKQACTTVTCLVVLTVCFTYFSFSHHSWQVKLVPEKQLPRTGQYFYRNTIPLSGAPSTKATSFSQNIGFRTVDKFLINNNFTTSKANSTNSGNSAVRHKNVGLQLPSVASSKLDIPPQVAQSSANTDSNSIAGSFGPVNPGSEEDGLGYYIQDNIRYDSKEDVKESSVLSDYSDYADYNTVVAEADFSEHAPVVQKAFPTEAFSAPRSYQSASKQKNVEVTHNPRNVSVLVKTPVTTQKTTPIGNNITTLRSTNSVKINTLPSTNESLFESPDYENEGDDSSWQMTRNSWSKTTTEKEEIFYNPQEVNLMSTEPHDFLTDYKNPCWVENVNTWYIDNVYLEVKNVRAVLTRMSAILRLRQEHGDHHRVRCLPYFLIIGQPKCGSTDLYEKLMAHPDATRPPTKEPHWWTRTRLGRHRAYGSIVPLADYVDLFDYAAYNIEQHPSVSDTGNVYHKMITGEGSMSTFWDNDHWWAMVGNDNTSEPSLVNPDYVHHLLPEAKLILILRNPTTRMYSDYLYFRKEDKVPTDFHNDVVNAISVYENCSRQASLRSCAYNSTVNSMAKIRLRVGMYAIYMRDWLRVFPREQFFIVRTEKYGADPKGVLRELYRFLGLGELSETHENRILSRKKANTRRVEDKRLGDMLPETRTLLENFYRPLNQELATLLKDNQFLWEDIKDR